ncbi:sensor domain-containing protein [Geoalkalibacter subterraneus]|uniref:sensor domain-containing protein n=1 Tax=Geoalkalibacter subterraneus TaxID=483547 RepID=UPI00069325B4|nr:EAL domain-containing protein [Geoalkalibacter subterraneus]
MFGDIDRREEINSDSKDTDTGVDLNKLFFLCILPVTLAIFAGEFLIALSKGYRPYSYFGWSLDPLFIASITVPTVYILLFMPLSGQFQKRKAIEKKLIKNEKDTRNLIDSLEEGVVRIDLDGICSFANHAAAKLLGFKEVESLIGINIHNQIHADRESEQLCIICKVLSQSETCFEEEITLYRSDGTSFPADYRVYPLYNEDSMVGATVIFTDISERQARDERIRQLAFSDILTGLPNRETFNDRLAQALHTAQRKDFHVAVFYLDLDRFKAINDTLGHETGDILLQQVGARLTECVRKSDTVARLGGDEFVIMLPFIRCVEDANKVARKIMASFEKPFVINGKKVHTATSVGVAIYPHNGEDIQTLVKHADAAMYHAKSLGRQNVQFFSREISAQIEKKIVVENDLRLALEGDQFEMVYQPLIDTREGHVCGVEALLRWRHPSKGVISPGDFIAIAEESGLIVPIGEKILQTVCLQIKQWQQDGYEKMKVAVNVSSNQFKHPDFINVIRRVLVSSKIDPAGLELEITESTLMNIRGDITEILNQIRDLGVSLSIDDFGTGYSSLSYLKHFPIGKIKIDRSFVRDIPQDTNDSAIVETIIAMGHALGIKTIAEGVETLEQLEFLCARKCDEIQGYYFKPPMSPADLEKFMIEWSEKQLERCPPLSEKRNRLRLIEN